MSKSETMKVLESIEDPKLNIKVGLDLLEDKVSKLKERIISDLRNNPGND